MKILQILPELHVGGVETGTIDLARYLVAHGHEAVVVSNGGALVTDLEAVGARHIPLPVHDKSLWSILWCAAKLTKILRAEKADVVHARSRVPGWIAYLACLKTQTPFVTTCHGYYSKSPFSHVMGWGKVVIVPSRVIGQHMIQDFGVVQESIRLIARSVDLERFSVPRVEDAAKASCTVSIVGRLTPIKGHEYFLRAMVKVARRYPYLKVWIIGDAADQKAGYKEKLKLLTHRLGLDDHVEFLGNRRDVPQLLAQTDVLALSTVTQESFGRVILEAQAAGVPVVATKVGGVMEVIDDGKTGLLVLPMHPEEMADAVIRLLEDKALARRLVANAKEKIFSQYTVERMASETLKVYEEVCYRLKILVVKFGALGDILLITPSLKAIRARFPKARIFCLVAKDLLEILMRCPYIDELISYDSAHKHRGWLGIWKLGKRMRAHRFDKVIDLQNNRKSHLVSFLSLCPQRYGYRNKKWGGLLTNAIKDTNAVMPAVQHQFRLLNLLGITRQGDESLEVWPSASDEKYIDKLLEGEWIGNETNVVGISLSASERWDSKNWPPDRMAQLCDLLAAKNVRVVLTGTETDRIKARKITMATKSKPADLAGKTTILQLACLIKRCRVFVTGDSAPLHLAAAVRTPVVALFGPTDPLRHMPPMKRVKVVAKSFACMPCYASQCPIKTHVCMRNILSEEVAQAIEDLMPKKTP